MERINRKKKIKGDEEIIPEIRKDSAARKGVEERKVQTTDITKSILVYKENSDVYWRL
jgi:hypothetical protein